MATVLDRQQPTGRALHWEHAVHTRRPLFIAAIVGLASFLVSELMHLLLVADMGRRWERMLAEAISAIAVALLVAMLMRAEHRYRALVLLRLQVISEMNEHVRTALLQISTAAQSIEDQQSIQKIASSVDHIEWALKEVLLRRAPAQEGERSENEALWTRKYPQEPSRGRKAVQR